MFNPENLTVSKLRFYSIGIAAQNKSLSTDILEVTPTEELTMLEGEVTANQVDYKAKGVDSNGKAYNSSVTNKVSMKAQWLPIGSSNRLTSPDVRRGESVMIYQFADADKYYWCTLKQDSHLRRLETVIFAFSGTSSEVDKLTPDNSYFLEISTHRKSVTFHTSKANGEPFSYDVQINTKDGSIIIADDVGNEFLLDSKANRIFMKNTDNSSVDVNKQNIIMNADASIQLKTKAFSVVSENTLIDGAFMGSGNGTFAGDLKINKLESDDISAGNVKAKSLGLK